MSEWVVAGRLADRGEVCSIHGFVNSVGKSMDGRFGGGHKERQQRS